MHPLSLDNCALFSLSLCALALCFTQIQLFSLTHLLTHKDCFTQVMLTDGKLETSHISGLQY